MVLAKLTVTKQKLFRGSYGYLIVLVFCLCDDLLKALRQYEEPQCQMKDAEVMTAAIVAMLYFKGNFRLTSQFLYEYGYMPQMLSRSRFNRRLHRIDDLFLTLFLQLGEHWKQLNERSTYVLDSYRLPRVITTAFHAVKCTLVRNGVATFPVENATSMAFRFIF